jgi:glycine/D-amino acid oxidase-like deaminating enzyme
VSAHDVIVIGAGSVGNPIALSLARAGYSVAVFDSGASPGRGENKAAIGGIRATHSDRAKIRICTESLRIFKGWQEVEGDDIGWRQGGYTFPAYDDAIEGILKSILPGQLEQGLDIGWHGPERIGEVVPGIVPEGLRGGTYSPGDGSASPLLCAHAFKRAAEAAGAVYHMREAVASIRVEGGKVLGVTTSRGSYDAGIVVNAAGSAARAVGAMAGVDVPVEPDSHEAGITEPVARFIDPMVVDLRPGEGSKNFYFHQNSEGQVIFCITPNPIIPGTDCRSTSVFLPQIAQRMVALLPRLMNLKVRRVWRGLYPMTPDGAPILGWAPGVEGLLLAAGMCGQGFMLGPGVGELTTRFLMDRLSDRDREVLDDLRPDRDYAGEEALK